MYNNAFITISIVSKYIKNSLVILPKLVGDFINFESTNKAVYPAKMVHLRVLQLQILYKEPHKYNYLQVFHIIVYLLPDEFGCAAEGICQRPPLF